MKHQTNNTLSKLLQLDNRNLLSLYYTVGYPKLDAFDEIFEAIADAKKVDFVELGMPYSDPLADGPTIQKTSSVAIANGVTFEKYFDIAFEIKHRYNIPLVFMGYLNPVLQFGIEDFCIKCLASGIEGIIIPDLPVNVYTAEYKAIFEQYNLLVNFLITPTTSTERIRQIEEATTGFIYVVSSNSITGKLGQLNQEQQKYFERIQSLHLRKPTMIGFGIHDKQSFANACKYANGAIIGSAFLRILEKDDRSKTVQKFIQDIQP